MSDSDFCAIIDIDQWRVCALSRQNQWWYQGYEWKNLQFPTRTIQQQSDLTDLTPPFLQGLLSIIAFDGRFHGWLADHSVALHQPSGQWYIWGTAEHVKQINALLQTEPPQRKPVATNPEHTVQYSMTQEQYETAVHRTQEAIRDGNVYQINLAHQVGPFTINNPMDTWLNLTETNPSHHACFWKSPSEVLLCNSPELFLSFDQDGGISSLPIKGTQTDLGNPKAHFALWDSVKEQAELTMIVDMMRNDISSVAEYGSVYTEHRRLRRCGDLLHAEQKVLGQRRQDLSILQAVHTCFPPASVTGAPKESALSYISSFEPVSRGWYTGSFGFIDTRGYSTWNVIIRTLQGHLDQQGIMTAYLNIGAGIVYDSNAQSEWHETIAKGRAIERTLKKRLT